MSRPAHFLDLIALIIFDKKLNLTDPYCVIFFSLLFVLPSLTKVSPYEPFSRIPSACDILLMSKNIH